MNQTADPGRSPSPFQTDDILGVEGSRPPAYFWLWVTYLLGLDYFSTLAYQPSITFAVAGPLGPLATLVVVLVTLFGALPVYYYLVGRSPGGQGSLGMVAKLVRGWRGKTLVLVLLGFAVTDFVMLKTISVADAAVHLIGNPHAAWQASLDSLTDWCCQAGDDLGGPGFGSFFTRQLVVTLLLGCLGFVLWSILRQGFNRNVMLLAVPLVGVFLLLNGLLIVSGLLILHQHPEMVDAWWRALPQESHFGWGGTALLCLVFFPHLALGLSGFEMNMILMPQVKGHAGDDAEHLTGRIRNTRKVLVAAAVIMSLFLLGASLVTTLLIPAEALGPTGRAANRALAYLAHGEPLRQGAGAALPFCGLLFGSVYDLVTILVLALAGTSVVTALGVYLPQFLLRFGMEFKWIHRWGVLLLIFAGINLAVTLWFRASVHDQRGAYATAVLVLLACAAVVAAIDRRKRPVSTVSRLSRLARSVKVGFFALVAAGFLGTTLVVVWNAPEGLWIAGIFLTFIFAMSVSSRALRADELRTIGFAFVNEPARFLWDSLRLADFPVLIPHRPGRDPRALKEQQIRSDHCLNPQADVVFLEVEVEDPSEFYQNLLVDVIREDHCFIIKVTRCVSTAHAIAAVALEMSRYSRPPNLHFGWTEMDLLSASWSYLAFGEGNIPWKVRELIVRAEPDPKRRPRVIVG